MTEWTSQAVASRFAEAARTARRLPPVRVQGHFNVWPPFVRTEAEVLCAEDPPPRRFPPSPAEIERMLVTMRWVQAANGIRAADEHSPATTPVACKPRSRMTAASARPA